MSQAKYRNQLKLFYDHRKLILVATALFAFSAATGVLRHNPRDSASISVASLPVRTSSCAPPKGLRPLKKRDEMGILLEEMGFTTGAEIGVQRGKYAATLLNDWKSCKVYKLIDLWAQQENYKDFANVDDKGHEQNMEIAQRNVEKFGKNVKTEFMKMTSVEAANLIDDESLDFAYIDARHDYCGVLEDLKAYWPKVRPGGIMAGHDFIKQEELPGGQDWSLCMDGTRNSGAVRGAVEEFCVDKGLTISVAYAEDHIFRTWMVQKQMC
jgi:hypothetical protein